MNKVILTGRLTADIELAGKKDARYANFTIAVRDGKDADGNDRAQFIRCVIFGKGAEIMEMFCAKGSPVSVCGRLNNSSYEDEDGNTRWSTSVIVDDFDLIGGKKPEEEEEKKPAKSAKKYHK